MKHFIFVYTFFLLALCGCKMSEERQNTIALLTPVTHPSLEAALDGFIQTVETMHPGKYRFIVYNAQGNKTLMRSEIEEIIRQNPALVLTVGTTASQMVTKIFSVKSRDTPVVFTCVSDPIGFDIVSSEESPGGNVTGVKEVLDFGEELKALIKFKPDLTKVLLVYNPMEAGLSEHKQQIETVLSNKGISLISVEVFQTNEIHAKSSAFMHEADALVVLKDNTVVSGLDALIKLCKRYRVPLMTSDLDSPARGAAFGYGVLERDFGVEAAKKALLILEHGVHPGSIAVTPVSAFSLRINSKAALEQGINSGLLESKIEEERS